MRALVAGGGIAGPATALALQRAGIEAVVLEAWPEPTGEVGSYFTVSPNGVHALDTLGVLDRARQAGFATRENVMFGATGRRLGSIPLGRPLGDGTVGLTMKRSRLGAVLWQEARRRGIEVRFDARVCSVASTAGAATVTLANGESLQADLVVGADGVHSVVRGAIDADAPRGRYVGLANFGGITRATPVVRELLPEAWHFVFGRKAFFGAHPTPDGDVVWFVNVPRPAIDDDERLATTPEQWRGRLAELLAEDAGPGAALVESGELELMADNTHDLPHVPRWHRDRLVVIGDAAHAPSPSSGQGASMALEDAVVLATSLRDAGSVPEALVRFERLRRARVERIVAVGARSSSTKTPGRLGRIVQEAVMPLVFRYVVTERSQEWMTGYRVSWDEAALRHDTARGARA
jgi:2-polyprenyl-6-methoxyphenol hydroxylase-like FAD-dependent oxidoreductase